MEVERCQTTYQSYGSSRPGHLSKSSKFKNLTVASHSSKISIQVIGKLTVSGHLSNSLKSKKPNSGQTPHQISTSSKSRLNIIRKHRSPCRPVMPHICSPNIKLVINSFIIQYFCKSPGGTWIFILAASR